ncbi:MAG: ABC transporter ATP-binding protein [Bacteroidales bacterium]
MQPAIEAQHIIKDFANHRALDDVSLSVPEQQIFGLLGPNGAGKTTLIRIINQITAPDSGEILFNGRALRSDDVSQIGYLPEERGLYKKMKVGEQAMYLAQLKGLSANEAKQRLKSWFEKFDIMNWWNRKVEELSKGMQQKVQFIVTVVHEPKLMIFDEPFSGFDPINVNLLKDHILDLKNNGATIIFSTHNMASVEELCDNIALIHRSKTILQGSVDGLKKQFKPDNFEIVYSNGKSDLRQLLGEQFMVLEESKKEHETIARIHLEPGSDANQLIAKLLPHVNIHAFREILPSMNDIFISQVNKNESSNG